MAIGDEIGSESLADLNQYVHSWLDDLERRLRSILEDYELRIHFEKKEKKP